MSCGFSPEWLALHAEDDLDGETRELTRRHLGHCRECEIRLEQLRGSQRLLKTLRQETATSADCLRMRRGVMSAVAARPIGVRDRLLSLERLFVLGVRRQAYALAALALVVVSVSVVAQNRSAVLNPRIPLARFADEPMFVGRDALLRPDGYRRWVALLPGGGHGDGMGSGAVYINPDAYREYEKTRTLPEGTVMIWEAAPAHPTPAVHQPAMLLASVKSHARFESGWGFFDFSGADGVATRRAEPLPDSSGCRTCHLRDDVSDQVLTAF